jgi:uncharacterized cupredoxin-like copper-binding protein
MAKISGTGSIRLPAIAAGLALILASGANAAGQRAAGQHGGGHGHGHGPGIGIGQPGKAAEVSRTIVMVMTDNRFKPAKITVKKAETIRFKVKNQGRMVHEFNIGTAAMHARHQKEMASMFAQGAIEIDRIRPDKMGAGHSMKHDDPNSVLLDPGKSAEVIWTFSTDATLEFACNIPGHYEAGMKGPILIK